MNFLFNQPQVSSYNVQIYDASSKYPLVSQDWPSYESWQKQWEDKGIINKHDNKVFLSSLATSSAGNQPHSSTNTEYSARKRKLADKQDQQFAAINSQGINKSDIYLLLRNPQNIRGQTSTKGNALFAKIVQKSIQYDQTIKSNYSKKWIDKSLPRELQFQDSDSQINALEWKDINEVAKQMNQEIKIITTPIEKTDVIQGKLGDCYFLAAIAALANSTRPQRILRLFSSIQMNQQGVFKARLMFKGILQEVVVDSYFPFLKNGKEQGKWNTLGCSPNSSGEIYTMILQKCWAKLWKSYQRIDGGYPHEALHALSGALTKNYILQDETAGQSNSDNFFKQVFNYCKTEYVMCAGTGDTETMSSVDAISVNTQQKVKIWLASNHMYCVSEIFLEGNQKKVRMYNPWSFNYNAQSAKIGGQFQMTWQKFITCFHYLTVCKLHDNANYLSQSLKFQANKLKFIELTVRQAKSGYFAITISETDKKQKASQQGQQYLSITYIVVKVIKSKEGEHYELITIRTESQFSDHYLQLHNIEEGEYLIAVYISDPEVKQELTFGVYSQDCFGFRQKENVKPVFQNNFLPNVMLGYHHNIAEQNTLYYPVPQNRNIWISFYMLNHKQACLGYYLLHVSQGERAYQVNFGRSEFEQYGLSVLYPYNKECFKLVAEPGYESIATILIQDISKYKQRVPDKKTLYKSIKGKPQYKK